MRGRPRKKNNISVCGDIVTVELTRGYYTRLFKDDWKRISHLKFCALVLTRPNERKVVYAVAPFKGPTGKRTLLYMHRLIMDDIPKDHQIDHENLNTLDNVRTNLRAVTRSENLQNTGPRSNNRTGQKNIIPLYGGKFGIIKVLRKQTFSWGPYNSLEEAVKFRDLVLSGFKFHRAEGSAFSLSGCPVE